MKNLKIKNLMAVQEDFLGNNAVYHGYAGLSDDAGRVYSEELCELEADRAKALGLKIARTYYKWYSYDFENNCWDWENTPDYVAFCKWVERLKVRGIDVALNTGWCCPGDIMSNHWGGKSPFTVEGDWHASVANYAKWVSDTVHDLVEVRGLTNVKYLVMFTEPQNQNSPLPSGIKNTLEAWYDATLAAIKQLEKDKRRHLVKIVGPNEGSTITADMMRWIKQNFDGLVDVYTAHTYINARPTMQVNPGSFMAVGGTRGMRIQQKICLKPNTEYELRVTAAADIKDRLNASGYMLMGAFDVSNTQNGMFTAGSQPTTRLTRSSTRMIQASELKGELTEYSHIFKTENNTKNAAIGVFFDIVEDGHTATVTKISLKEKGNEKELLNYPEFERVGNWQNIALDIAGATAYDSWCSWAEIYKNVLGKDDNLWFDEYNTSGMGPFQNYHEPYHGTDLAVARVAFMNSGLQSNSMWTLFDQQWPNNHTNQEWHRYVDGDHRFGVMPVLTRSLTPYPAYYAIQITGYTGGSEGTKVYKGIGYGNINLTMSLQPDGTVTILAVNDGDKAEEIRISFEKPLNKTLYRYLYSPEEIVPDENATPIPTDKTFFDVSSEFSDTLPAGGVVAYTSKQR